MLDAGLSWLQVSATLHAALRMLTRTKSCVISKPLLEVLFGDNSGFHLRLAYISFLLPMLQ